jgi:cysteine synthase
MESFNPGGSVRTASADIIETAEREGKLSRRDHRQPTSGNTGIGLALICAVEAIG